MNKGWRYGTRNKTIEHGVKDAFYVGSPGEPYYRPVIFCLCGWSTERSDSWQHAGEQMDFHINDLASAERKQKR